MVFFVASAILWIRSYWRWDTFSVSEFTSWNFDSHGGIFVFSYSNRYPANIVSPGSNNPHVMHTGPTVPISSSLQFSHFSIALSPSRLVGKTFGFSHMRKTIEWAGDLVAWTALVDEGDGFSVPAWFATFLVGLLLAIAFAGKVRSRRRLALGRCAKCGYDLRATPDRCPEWPM